MIFHLTPAADFHASPAAAPYLPAQFDADGFIHCSPDTETLLRVANRFYKDMPGEMLALVIDPTKVTAGVKWEPPAHPDGSPAASGEPLFPHIYGPLNRDAIIEIRIAVRAVDGTFLSA